MLDKIPYQEYDVDLLGKKVRIYFIEVEQIKSYHDSQKLHFLRSILDDGNIVMLKGDISSLFQDRIYTDFGKSAFFAGRIIGNTLGYASVCTLDGENLEKLSIVGPYVLCVSRPEILDMLLQEFELEVPELERAENGINRFKLKSEIGRFQQDSEIFEHALRHKIETGYFAQNLEFLAPVFPKLEERERMLHLFNHMTDLDDIRWMLLRRVVLACNEAQLEIESPIRSVDISSDDNEGGDSREPQLKLLEMRKTARDILEKQYESIKRHLSLMGETVGRFHNVQVLHGDLHKANFVYPATTESGIALSDLENVVILMRKLTPIECASDLLPLFKELSFFEWSCFREAYICERGLDGINALFVLEAGNDVFYLNTAGFLFNENSQSINLVLSHFGGLITQKGFYGRSLLHYASANDMQVLASCLLELGADVDSIDEMRWTPLHRAAMNGNQRLAAMLLERGANVNQQDFFNRTPLLLAAAQPGDYVKLVLLLIESGASLDAVNHREISALHLAAGVGNYKILSTFLDRNMDVNKRAGNQSTPLIWAAEYGQVEVAKLLLSKGANVALACNHEWTPLHWAAHKGHKDLVELLIKHGAIVDSRNDMGFSPLHKAAHSGEHSICRLLIDHGANVNYCNAAQQVPLGYAIDAKNVAVTQLILESGADIHRTDIAGNTLLHIAAEKGCYQTSRALIERGIQVDHPNQSGMTPLHFAAKSGHCRSVFLLAQNDAKLDRRDNHNLRPLEYAVVSGHKCVVRVLLDLGADPNRGEVNAISPALLAAGEGHVDILEMLISSGCDYQEQWPDGSTLLHIAVDKNQYETVEFLLEKGLDVDAHSDTFLTPLRMAVANGNWEMLKLLVERGAKIVNIDGDGRTLADYVILARQEEIAKSLIAEGCVNRSSDKITRAYEAFINTAMNSYTEDADAMTSIGMWHLENDVYDVAIDLFGRAMEASTSLSSGQKQSLGQVLVSATKKLFESRRWEDALSVAKWVVDLGVADAEILCHLGVYFFSLGDYDEAILWLEKSVKEDPRLQAPHYWLAKIYMEKGMFKEEREEWLECIMPGQENKDRYRKGLGYHVSMSGSIVEEFAERLEFLDTQLGKSDKWPGVG